MRSAANHMKPMDSNPLPHALGGMPQTALPLMTVLHQLAPAMLMRDKKKWAMRSCGFPDGRTQRSKRSSRDRASDSFRLTALTVCCSSRSNRFSILANVAWTLPSRERSTKARLSEASAAFSVQQLAP